MGWGILALFLIYLIFTNKNINLDSAADFTESASEVFFSILGLIGCVILLILLFIIFL